MHKIGLGYDIHPLVPGRRFILGGVEIAHDAGPSGHSDGDALIHAAVDALLGALGEGDIGTLFPDTDPRHQDAASSGFLSEVMALVREEGWRVAHMDVVVVLENPKLAPYIPSMKAALCPVLGLEEKALSVKAKTNEGLGPVGEGRAVACWAAVLLEK